MIITRFVVTFVAIIAATAVWAAGEPERLDNDHLVPAPTADPTYATALRKYLFVTPDNFARITIMPSGKEGELSIALYSVVGSEDETALRLTCMRATENIWYATSESNPNRQADPNVPVQRVDATLPRDIANMLHAALTAQIARAKSSTHVGPAFVDGTEIEFSVHDLGGNVKTAVAGPITAGPTIDRLTRVVQLLRKYCDSPPERPRIIAELKECLVPLAD